MTSNYRSFAATAGLLAGLCLVTANAVQAKDTQVVWEGYATNTSTPPAACSGIGGTGLADTHVSIYRPHISSTDTPTFLSMMHLRAALTLQNTTESANKQMHGSGKYTGYGVNSRAKGFTYTGTYSFTITPSTVTTSTSVVNITGTIKNYYNTAGCNVTFKGVYVKRID
jgi:hypothetical protein